jgi:hypothetical protein
MKSYSLKIKISVVLLFILTTFNMHICGTPKNTLYISLSSKYIQNWKDTITEVDLPCYIINIASYVTETEAKTKVNNLKSKGYQVGYLWIPNFGSLKYIAQYMVYLGPYKTKDLCENALNDNWNVFPGIYGMLVSYDEKGEQIYSKQDTVGKGSYKIKEIISGLYFRIKILESSEEWSFPISEYSVLYNGKLYDSGGGQGYGRIIDPLDYNGRGVPDNTLEMCFSWWAGGGFYYYIAPTKKGIVIYKGWIDETQAENSYHWELFESIDKE